MGWVISPTQPLLFTNCRPSSLTLVQGLGLSLTVYPGAAKLFDTEKLMGLSIEQVARIGLNFPLVLRKLKYKNMVQYVIMVVGKPI